MHPNQMRYMLPSRAPSDQVLAEARVNGGMISAIDPSDLPNNAFVNLRNARVRLDVTERRRGHSKFAPVQKLPYRVLKVATFRDEYGTYHTLAFLPNAIYRRDENAWVLVTANENLHAAASDRISVVNIRGKLVYANNGADVIRTVDPIGVGDVPLGNAPKYKYITGFYNRVIGANRTEGGFGAIEVGWSGDGNIAEWDNLVDPSAGFTPLTESPTDESDPLTGIHGFSNRLHILRERSVWGATKVPSAANPFNFHNILPAIGCDCSYSVQVSQQGLIWFDTRTEQVWALGDSVDPIGQSVMNEIMRALTVNVLDDVFSGYDSVNDEYHLCIPSGTYVRVWTFSFKTKAWSYDELSGISSMDFVDVAGGYTSIDELGGTIDGLGGTINSLSDQPKLTPTATIGREDGYIMQEDTTLTDDGTAFELDLSSKQFDLPDTDEAISGVRFDCYIKGNNVPISFYYSRDGGARQVIAFKTWAITSDGTQRVILKVPLHVRCKQFQWHLLVGNCSTFKLLKYNVGVYRVGETKP